MDDGNGLAGSDYGDARLQSPTSRGSGSGDASAPAAIAAAAVAAPPAREAACPGACLAVLPSSSFRCVRSSWRTRIAAARETVSHTNLEKRHRTALAEMVSDGMASLDGTFDDMLDDQLEVRELHGAFEPPHAHQPQTAADAAAEPTTQPRPLSRSHMLSGTDEHGLRVRMSPRASRAAVPLRQVSTSSGTSERPPKGPDATRSSSWRCRVDDSTRRGGARRKWRRVVL